jgi:hypothetical protein
MTITLKSPRDAQTLKGILDSPDPAPLVVIENDQVVFITADYWIELTRINDRAALIEWIHHLLGKTWITNELLEQFIELVCNYRKWPIYRDV